MSMQFENLARQLAADRRASAKDVLALRQLGWSDGRITREEAEAIFAINRNLDEASEEWVDFFVEAIGEFVLNGTEPKGMCDESEARWLIEALDHDGRLDSMAELEVLVRIVERAQNVPDLLKDYALRQVEDAVLHGTGPTRDGGELSDAHITAAECRLLRRLIFASGGHGAACVSRHDAELLFRIKDATLGQPNAKEWADLFVDGITNYLRGFALDRAQLSHERQRELLDFVQTERAGHGAFFAQMARSRAGLGERVRWALEALHNKDGANKDYFARTSQGQELTDAEEQWLDEQMGHDGQVDELEKRVIRRLADLA